MRDRFPGYIAISSNFEDMLIMKYLSNFVNKHKKDLLKWSSAFIIISSFFTSLYTIIDSKNDSKINIVLQNGTTMLQDLTNDSRLQNVLVHNLVVIQENCGYLNRQRDDVECEKSHLYYEKVKTEIQISDKRVMTSQKRYTSKANELAKKYDNYNYWQSVLIIFALVTNLVALILNHKAK